MLESGFGLECAWPPPVTLVFLLLDDHWLGPAVPAILIHLVNNGELLLHAGHLSLGGGRGLLAQATRAIRATVLAGKGDAHGCLVREVATTLEGRGLFMNFESLLQDPIELIRILLSEKMVAIVISEQVISCLLVRLLGGFKYQGFLAQLSEVTAFVHYATLEVFVAQLCLGLHRKLSRLGALMLTPPYKEEHDCDAQGGEHVIYGEVDYAELVEDLHPIFCLGVSLGGHAPEYECDGVEDDEEHDEERAADLVGLELPPLFGQLRLLKLEEEREKLQEDAHHHQGHRETEPVHHPDERLVSIVKAEYLLFAFRSLLFPIIVKISWV